RPLCERSIGRWRAERLSFQVFRHNDAAALSADHRKWWPVVHHEHGFHRRAWLSIAVSDQRVDIAEPNVVFARRHTFDRFNRVGGGTYRDVEALRPVITLVERVHEERGRSFEAVVEGEFDDDFPRCGAGGQRRGDQQRHPRPPASVVSSHRAPSFSSGGGRPRTEKNNPLQRAKFKNKVTANLRRYD